MKKIIILTSVTIIGLLLSTCNKVEKNIDVLIENVRLDSSKTILEFDMVYVNLSNVDLFTLQRNVVLESSNSENLLFDRNILIGGLVIDTIISANSNQIELNKGFRSWLNKEDNGVLIKQDSDLFLGTAQDSLPSDLQNNNNLLFIQKGCKIDVKYKFHYFNDQKIKDHKVTVGANNWWNEKYKYFNIFRKYNKFQTFRFSEPVK